ncbi:DnaT-like ssDNA-binding domain-containing protein [Salinibius halmophilus]|uniref:DnaT-like ssDNA-binding domain-containing protein n=1 Tax=Salinibius halmophilus TaxID=1853216 RepID=UPI000E665DD8|nr:DnaT-like ssDNA-binding domain-containing protein [Salinibius halmophilus]
MTEQWLTLPLSLARQLGVEAALLLHQLQQWHALSPQQNQLRLSESELAHRLPFDLETLADLIEALEDAGLLQCSQHQSYYYFSFEARQAKASLSANERLQQAVANSAQQIRNAARSRNRQDWATWQQSSSESNDEGSTDTPEDSAHAKRNETIAEDWQPSATTLTMLSHQQIPQAFALAQRDAFVMWHLEKGTLGGFESRFISWVKRGWVDEQQQQQRNTATEPNHRSERERVRARLDDIFDTDW